MSRFILVGIINSRPFYYCFFIYLFYFRLDITPPLPRDLFSLELPESLDDLVRIIESLWIRYFYYFDIPVHLRAYQVFGAVAGDSLFTIRLFM